MNFIKLTLISLLFSCGQSALIQTKRAPANKEEIYKNAYPNGDVYFLIGDLSIEEADEEFAKFASVSRWLNKKGFRVIINTNAYESDLQEAVSNDKTVAIIWSSHGDRSGGIFASDNTKIRASVFNNDSVGKRLGLVVFSNCFGECTVNRYKLKKGIRTTFWEGMTDADDLADYLLDDDFDKDLYQATGKVHNKCQSALSKYLHINS